MTNVSIRQYYDNIIINIEGHSGYSNPGNDIVCAGISTLVCALLNALLDEESSGNIRIIRKFTGDGIVNLEFKPFDFSKNRIDGILSVITTGFYMLEDAYPDYIRIE